MQDDLEDDTNTKHSCVALTPHASSGTECHISGSAGAWGSLHEGVELLPAKRSACLAHKKCEHCGQQHSIRQKHGLLHNTKTSGNIASACTRRRHCRNLQPCKQASLCSPPLAALPHTDVNAPDARSKLISYKAVTMWTQLQERHPRWPPHGVSFGLANRLNLHAQQPTWLGLSSRQLLCAGCV